MAWSRALFYVMDVHTLTAQSLVYTCCYFLQKLAKSSRRMSSSALTTPSQEGGDSVGWNLSEAEMKQVEQAVIRRMLGSSAMLPLASEVESTNAITSVEEAMNEIDSIVKALQLSSTVDETVAKERLMEVMRSLNECFQGSRSWSDLSVSSLDMDEIISPAADVYDSDSSVDDDFLAQHRSHQRKLQETRLLEERVEELEGSLSRLSVQNARLRERARAQLE